MVVASSAYPLHPDVAEYITKLPIKSDNAKAPLFPALSKRKLNGRLGLWPRKCG